MHPGLRLLLIVIAAAGVWCIAAGFASDREADVMFLVALAGLSLANALV